MNVVVLSRGVKAIPGPGQELYADTRKTRTCGGRQNAYLYFRQAGEFTGKNQCFSSAIPVATCTFCLAAVPVATCTFCVAAVPVADCTLSLPVTSV
jgi:hypothetical protein